MRTARLIGATRSTPVSSTKSRSIEQSVFRDFSLLSQSLYVPYTVRFIHFIKLKKLHTEDKIAHGIAHGVKQLAVGPNKKAPPEGGAALAGTLTSRAQIWYHNLEWRG